MNRNVEIKAKVADLAGIQERTQALADDGPVALDQEDTFFVCPRGRLKLRQFSSTRAELIYYERPDSAEPKESRYRVYPTSDPDGLRQTLAAALGIRGVVRKRRTLYLIGPTRVHLDRVEGLGDFVELEVVLQPGEPLDGGVTIAHDLMDRLGIPRSGLVQQAYIDLVECPPG